jgi:hypothetical protein
MGRAFGPEFTGMATNLNAKAQRREDARGKPRRREQMCRLNCDWA